MFDPTQELTNCVLFFREDFFYPVYGRPDEDWLEHVAQNPGTTKVMDLQNNVIWPICQSQVH